jgi:ribonuclease HI
MKDQMRSEFEMKDLGPLRYFVGILVQRDRERRTLRIDQSGYIDMILQRFDMENSAPVATPIATGTKLVKATDNDEVIDAKPYQSMVGSQMYAMLCTRPDIAFAVSQVSQFNASPTSTHEVIARRILRYLKGSMDLGIEYSGKKGLVLKVFVDADWGASENRRSIGGYIVIFAGGAISWSCKKQGSVALSSTEAEYMALVQALKESIWLQRLLKELGRQAENAKTVYEDNQGAIALANNPEYHARTKHIDIQYHFVRECVENGDIELEYCPTADMVADALTKALPKDRHWMLLERMGMKSATASPS